MEFFFFAGGCKDLHVVGVRPQPARCVSVGVNKDWVSSCTYGEGGGGGGGAGMAQWLEHRTRD